MITANENEGPLRKLAETADDREKKRFNVAVSRAKDQIWLVHSLDSDNDLKENVIKRAEEILDEWNLELDDETQNL